MSSTPSTLEVLVVSEEINRQHAEFKTAANDPNIPWEDVSKMASLNNLKLLRLMETTNRVATRMGDAAVDQAVATGLRLFEAAATHVDPDFIPDLVAGINVMAMRVREGALQGAPLPMNYMDPGVRKELFLLESGLRHLKLGEERKPE